MTTLGADIDGAVRRTSTTYEVRGMREKITNYDNATVGSGSVVNEVVLEYNDLGMLVKEYQEHEGAKDGNTLYVQYNFDDDGQRREVHQGPAAVVGPLPQWPPGALHLRLGRQHGRCLESAGRHQGR